MTALPRPLPSASWIELVARLRAFVARRVHPADVDDVMQEVLVRVHEKLGDLDDLERFDAWVYRIARNCIADAGRSRARLVLHHSGEEPAEAVVDEGGAPAAAEARERDEVRACLLACLARLVAEMPAPYRQALTLTELEGLTQDEAARVEGVSLSGMKSRVQRGRRMLRALYDDCCFIAQDARGAVSTCESWSTSPCGCAPSCGTSS